MPVTANFLHAVVYFSANDDFMSKLMRHDAFSLRKLSSYRLFQQHLI